MSENFRKLFPAPEMKEMICHHIHAKCIKRQEADIFPVINHTDNNIKINPYNKDLLSFVDAKCCFQKRLNNEIV